MAPSSLTMPNYHIEADILKEPDVVIISNKRPIQVYSNKVLKMIRLQNFRSIKLVAAGGAVSTALRVARHVVATLAAESGQLAVSEIVEQSEIASLTSEIPTFGSIPDVSATPVSRAITQIVVVVRVVS